MCSPPSDASQAAEFTPGDGSALGTPFLRRRFDFDAAGLPRCENPRKAYAPPKNAKLTPENEMAPTATPQSQLQDEITDMGASQRPAIMISALDLRSNRNGHITQ